MPQTGRMEHKPEGAVPQDVGSTDGFSFYPALVWVEHVVVKLQNAGRAADARNGL